MVSQEDITGNISHDKEHKNDPVPNPEAIPNLVIPSDSQKRNGSAISSLSAETESLENQLSKSNVPVLNKHKKLTPENHLKT
ncbi:hypothetical protein JTB14_037300 [Gonioctena quinquepunctata]|nr:hypothetical protein JTB14_037300 [Gonioctena quinquepunctata]